MKENHMKKLMTAVFGICLLGAPALNIAAQNQPAKQEPSAKQDVKDAGHDVKTAGKATGQAAKKTGSAVKTTTKKGVNKSAKVVGKGADKVGDKTQGNTK
jgi:hypothetical protein